MTSGGGEPAGSPRRPSSRGKNEGKQQETSERTVRSQLPSSNARGAGPGTRHGCDVGGTAAMERLKAVEVFPKAAPGPPSLSQAEGAICPGAVFSRPVLLSAFRPDSTSHPRLRGTRSWKRRIAKPHGARHLG